MQHKYLLHVVVLIAAVSGPVPTPAAEPAVAKGPAVRSIAGIYPHLVCTNQESECGIGAVVPWADRLWVITYAPHQPAGSSDKLYGITPDLEQRIFPSSVGGTPANRLIHSESNQLFIGPYCIDAAGTIRTIPPTRMFGRLTGTARHLFDPAKRVYFATMEEGLYEVDVETLAVNCLIRDGNAKAPPQGIVSKLPGYHGKGLYAGQQRLVYANNGERHPDVGHDPTIPSGALAEWTGSGDWQLVRRNQFTEVTGPGGIRGSTDPNSPIWTLGWDAKSIILGLLEAGQWHFYRLPKGSHSYDGSHGWNTEWPRIREIGEADLLATMHGTFWRFPAGFSRRTSGGIQPRSNYLKVVGDFCRWQDRVVLGCDDSAKSEFLNTRPFKARHAGPGQSNSNLWFLEPSRLDQLGPAIGRGSVWLRDDLADGTVSEPFLFSGYDHRQLTISHSTSQPVTFALEVDREGDDTWTTLEEVPVPAMGVVFHQFTPAETAAWIRLRTVGAATQATAHFHFRNRDPREAVNDSVFSGLATAEERPQRYGLMQSLSARTLGLVAGTLEDCSDSSYYELNQSLELLRVDNPETATRLVRDVAQPAGSFSVDEASVLLIEDGRRYRLPFSFVGEQQILEDHGRVTGYAQPRVCREVATERDLLNIAGTFYELPARNAGGVAKLRPVCTHNLAIHDYCSHNGLLLLTGLDADTTGDRIIRSSDGRAAVWVGVVDDLWRLGKPRGHGGPWCRTNVLAGLPSDPYLMAGYDRKRVAITAKTATTIRLEVDVDGTRLWVPYESFAVQAGQTVRHSFPEGFGAYWVRSVSTNDTEASVIFEYD